VPFLPKLWEYIDHLWWFVLPITSSIFFILLGHIHGAETREGSIASVYRQHESVLDEIEVNKYGVKWKATWGYSRDFQLAF